MKAAQVQENGKIAIAEIPEPQVKEGQILVEVLASSVNPFDVKLASGKTGMTPPLPYIPGGDFSGKVKEVGSGASEYKVGDELFGSAMIFTGGSGAYAQFATANITNVTKKPGNINFEEAGSLPLVASSAVQALEDHINLLSGQRILIHGGAGGIGSIAIQLAKHLGAYVATTVSSDDMDFAKSLGADEVIDYENEKFEEKLADFDAVLDDVGGDVKDRSFKVLKKGGVLVSMLGQPSEQLAKQYQVTAIGQYTQTNSEHLERVRQLVEGGSIKPQVDKIFSLEEVKQAFDYLENGSPKGKIVIKIS